jgi:hypothetical protein
VKITRSRTQILEPGGRALDSYDDVCDQQKKTEEHQLGKSLFHNETSMMPVPGGIMAIDTQILS